MRNIWQTFHYIYADGLVAGEKTQSYLKPLELVGQDIQSPPLEMRERILAYLDLLVSQRQRRRVGLEVEGIERDPGPGDRTPGVLSIRLRLAGAGSGEAGDGPRLLAEAAAAAGARRVPRDCEGGLTAALGEGRGRGGGGLVGLVAVVRLDEERKIVWWSRRIVYLHKKEIHTYFLEIYTVEFEWSGYSTVLYGSPFARGTG